MSKIAALFSFRLRGRLMFTVLLAAICSIGVVAAAMLTVARIHAERTAVEEVAQSLKLRAESLERYLREIEGDLLYLAANPTTGEAIDALHFNYDRVSPEALRTAYISGNPHPVGEKHKLTQAQAATPEEQGYHAIHGRVHRALRPFLEERGYYDIFLISPEGDIVYTVFKELDYGTNLRTGLYSESGLARVWKAALQAAPGRISFADFEPYAPSYGAPASFLAVPVMGQPGSAEEGELKGVLAVQVPIARLSEAISGTSVAAEQDAFVTGSDGVLRTDSIRTEGDDVLTLTIDAGAIAADGVIRGTDLLGHAAFIGAQSVDVFGTTWKVVETRTEDSAFLAYATQRDWALLSLLPVVLAAFVTAWLSARALVRPVDTLQAAARDLAAGKRVDIPTKTRSDELGELSRAMLEVNETAVAARRAEWALRVSSVAVAICDTEFRIVFANDALRDTMRRSEDYWRKQSPGFSSDRLVGESIDIFHKQPENHRAMLRNMRAGHETEVDFDGKKIGLAIFPIDDEIGRIGYMLQWQDLTSQRATEAAIEGAIAAASEGDFTRRVSLDSDTPFYQMLENGLNAFFEEVETFLADLDGALTDFAGGDLRVQLAGSYRGQLGAIADRVADTAAELEAVIAQVKEAGHAIRESSHEISEDANDLAQRTESQGASVEQTAASMEEISSTVKENAENSAVADARAAEATELAEKGREVVARTVAAMAAIRESAGQISEVTSIIESLAFETHLLSLNASVEAARAGEAGKGFGVVAAEVGSLARRSTDEAKAIKKLITTSEQQVAEGDRLVGETDKALSEIIAAVRTAADMINQIADASSGQSKSIDEIAIAVAEMDNMTQQNSQLAEKSSIGASALAEQAERMMEAVAIFTTDDAPREEARQDAVWTSMRQRRPDAKRA